MSHAHSNRHVHPGQKSREHTTDNNQALADAKVIYKALTAGWFTNEDNVFKVLCNRTIEQLVDIRSHYQGAHGLNRDMLDDVKSNTHGHFEDLCIALIMRPSEYDAYRIHRALDHLAGAHEDELTEILAHREPYEVRELNAEHTTAYGKSAHAALEKSLSGEIGLLFSLLADPNNERKTPDNEAHQIELDVQALYDASQGRMLGHHAEPFIRIFAQRNREYLRKVYNGYANKHGKTLEAIISGWTLGGHVAKTLLAIITPPEEYYSNRLYEAMKGIGTNNSTLIRVLISQRERYLPAIANHFMHTHKKTLKDEVKSETSGDFKHALDALLTFYAEAK